MNTPSLDRQPTAVQHVHRTITTLMPEAALVGGAVRDILLDKPVSDLDYTVPQGARRLARAVADRVGGAYYALDDARDVGRVVWLAEDSNRLVIDIAAWQGPTLEDDLRGRDFTLNAVAILADGRMYDPLAGADDLQQRLLRPCSAHSLQADPLRSLRAVRFLLALDARPAEMLHKLTPQAAAHLHTVSPERRREEWLKILRLPHPEHAFPWLERWQILPHLLPAMLPLRGLEQPPPHVCDVYDHTLAVLHHLTALETAIRKASPPDDTVLARAYQALRPFAPQLRAYLEQELAHDHPRWLWLRFAAIAHDWGKATTQTRGEDGRLHFIGHEQESARLAQQWLHEHHLAKAEVSFVTKLCELHMRPMLLLAHGQIPSPRARFRLYRAAGSTAKALLLLQLADALGAAGKHHEAAGLDDYLPRWLALFAPLFAEKAPLPQPLLNGKTVIEHFSLQPGPLIGQLLSELQEAQALGEVQDSDQALAWLQQRLAQHDL